MKNVTEIKKIISKESKDISSWWEWIRSDKRALKNMSKKRVEVAIVIRNSSIGDLQNHCL